MSSAKQNVIEIDLLRRLVDYNSDTGELWWRERPLEMFSAEMHCKMWNTRYAGKPALIALHKDGYRRGSIFDTRFLAHRVLWALHHGKWPEEGIDHINGDQADNRISNLRVATQAENNRNASLRRDNTSGHVGVHRNGSAVKPWKAEIRVDGRNIYLGLFPTKEEAISARKAAEVKHGYHPNHGRG